MVDALRWTDNEELDCFSSLGILRMAEHNKESSMEEILSSIKRIIAEDKMIESGQPAARDKRSSPDEEASPHLEPVSDNVTPIASLPKGIVGKRTPIKSAAIKGPENGDEVLELTNEVKSNASSSAQGVFGDRRTEDRLINDQKLDAMRQSLSALVAMDSAAAPAPAKPKSGPSLEDLTRDLMRPMLEKWLNENLPALIEEMVAREIRRISDK